MGWYPFFPKHFTVGVLNSILRCVRLVSGAVSASLGFVSPIICLPSFVSHHLSPIICLPSFVSHHLSPIICLPCPVSGAVSASLGSVSHVSHHLSPTICLPSFVSHVLCQGLFPLPWASCLPSCVSHHLSSIICLRLFVSYYFSPMSCVRGCVRLPGLCVSHHLSPIICLPCPVSGAVSASLGSVSPIICLPSFLSHVLCQGSCPPPWALCLPSFVCHHMSPTICLPSFASHYLSSIICLPCPVSGAVSTSLGFVSPIICLPLFVSHYLSPSSFSPHLFLNCMLLISELLPRFCVPIIFLSLEFESVTALGLHSWVHCVGLSGCLSFLASVPLVPPTLASGVRLSGFLFCLSMFLMFPGVPFMCLPVWRFRVSGCLSSLFSLCFSPSLALDAWWCPVVQISFFPRLLSFVSRSG